jgi:hypothetical protein
MSAYAASNSNSSAPFQVKVYALDKVYCLPLAKFVPIGDVHRTRVGKTHCAIVVNGQQIRKMRLCDMHVLDQEFESYKRAASTALKNIEIFRRSS